MTDKNNSVMGEVREQLMETLRGMKSGDIKPEQAKAVASVAQTLINSYTLQVRAINALGSQVPDGFVRELTGEEPQRPKLPPAKPNAGAPAGEGIHARDPLYDARRPER